MNKANRKKGWYIYPDSGLESKVEKWKDANEVDSINKAVLMLLTQALGMKDNPDRDEFDRLENRVSAIEELVERGRQ